MTTIAASVERLVMVADTQLTCGDSVIYRTSKLVRLPCGGVAGGSGVWNRAYAAMQYLAEGSRGEPPDIDGAALLILKDRRLWVAENGWPAFPLLDEFAAIGCGSQAAMVLMGAGKTPAQAVGIVCGFDAATSEPLEVMRVKRK